MENNPRAGKVFYALEMQLETALHIGTGEETPTGASEIVSNGCGEYIIPGSSVAGIFLTTLEAILGSSIRENIALWKKLTLRNNKENDSPANASYLVFRTATIQPAELAVRDRVAIDNQWRTAKDQSKFSYWEIIPENTGFIIFIEIDNISLADRMSGADFSLLKEWIKAVCYTWSTEGVSFGAFSSSGNGWSHLVKCSYLEIDQTNISDYLNHSLPDLYNKINWKILYKRNSDIKIKKPAGYESMYHHYQLTIQLGNESDDGYGTDGLLIKGGDSCYSLADNQVDGVFINTGKRLFIPGSSIKGAFSAFMQRCQCNAWTHFTGQDENHETAGAILICDAFCTLSPSSLKAHLLPIERHAEDEFTRAVYGTAKFNEERLFHTAFTGKILINRKRINEEAEQQIIDLLKQGMEKRLIPLGANACFPVFRIKAYDQEFNNE